MNPSSNRTDTPGMIPGVTNAIFQGLTLGYGDEITGNIVGALTPGLSREDAVARERAYGESFRKDNKLASFLGELAGGTLLFGKFGAGQSWGRQAAVAGAAGATAASGSAAGGVGDRSRAAAAGGVAGLALGATGTAAGKVGGAAVDLFKLRPQNTTNGWSKIVSTISEKADELTLNAMKRDKSSPAAVLAKHAEAPNTPSTAMELAGENTVGLARAAATVPGSAKNTINVALEERMGGQMGRILDEVEERLGTTIPDALDKVEELVTLRKANAATSYPKAYTHTVDDDRVKTLLTLPDFAKAYQTLRQSLKIKGEDIPELFRVEVNPATGKKMAVLTDEPIPVKIIDYVKQATDDYIRKGMTKGKIDRTRADALRTRMGEILDIVDAKVPDYAKARKIYAGDSQMLASLDAGRGVAGETTRQLGSGLPDFLKDDPRLVQKALDKMRADGRVGELEMYKIGAYDALRTKMGKVREGRDVAGWLQSPENKAHIRALFDNDRDFGEFVRRLNAEDKISKTSRHVGGTSTPKVMGETAELASGALDVLLSASTGHPAHAIGPIARGVKRMQGITDLTAESIANRLLAGSKDPAELIEAMGQLSKTERLLAERAQRRGALKAGTSAAAGQGLVRE